LFNCNDLSVNTDIDAVAQSAAKVPWSSDRVGLLLASTRRSREGGNLTIMTLASPLKMKET